MKELWSLTQIRAVADSFLDAPQKSILIAAIEILEQEPDKIPAEVSEGVRVDNR